MFTTRVLFINSQFAQVHRDLSHTYPIHDTSLSEINAHIQSYMRTYKQFYTNKVIPKQHILEHHCLPFVSRYKIGLGLLGEQGGELIHSSIGKLEKRIAGIRDETRKLKTIMECHLIQVAPMLQRFVPTTKKRKLQQKDSNY